MRPQSHIPQRINDKILSKLDWRFEIYIRFPDTNFYRDIEVVFFKERVRILSTLNLLHFMIKISVYKNRNNGQHNH